MRRMLVELRINDQIDAVDDLFRNFAESGRSGLAGNIGRGRNQRFAQFADQTFAELMVGNADPERSFFGNQVSRYAARLG